MTNFMQGSTFVLNVFIYETYIVLYTRYKKLYLVSGVKHDY